MDFGKEVVKVLMIVRSTCYSAPGGDSTQVVMTAKYLRKLGAEVDITLANSTPLYENYSIIHFFNVIRPDDILPHINHKVPFCISTIFVDYSEYDNKIRKGVAGLVSKVIGAGNFEYIKAIARYLKNGDKIKSKYYLLNGHNKSIKHVAKKAAMLLPNSNSEYFRFSRYTNVKYPYRKIVNAIDKDVFDNNVESNDEFKNYVICVGRIEGLKNQLNLIKALKDTTLSLAIIGKPSPNHLPYWEACKSEAANCTNIKFVEHLRPSDLTKIYKAAKVHVLPSWFETTGLSSLEAAAMDCNVVITDKGDTTEYFQDMAYYCEPDDIESIKKAVMAAYDAPVNPKFKDYILEHYIWEQTAQQTLAAYQEVLKQGYKDSKSNKTINE